MRLEAPEGDATGARRAYQLSKSFTKACSIDQTDGVHRNYLFVNESAECTQGMAEPVSVDVTYIPVWTFHTRYPIGRCKTLIWLRIGILA